MGKLANGLNKSGKVLLMLVKKKTAVIAVVALLSCIAVYLNWSYQRGIGEDGAVDASGNAEDILGEAEYVDGKNPTATPASSNKEDYFASVRLTRQKSRDEAISTLEKITKNASSTKEAIKDAEGKIAQLADNAVTEARIESLVKAKGYKECVALIKEDGVSIVVPPQEGGLKTADVAKIKDIAVSESGLTADKVKITEAN